MGLQRELNEIHEDNVIMFERLDFAKSLNARERLLVHEACDELGLKNESVGEGRKRFVRVYHPTRKVERPTEVETSKPIVNPDEIVVDVGDGASSESRVNVKDDGAKAQEKSSSSSDRPEAASTQDNSLLNELEKARRARAEETQRRQELIRKKKEDAKKQERHEKLEKKKANKEAGAKGSKEKGGDDDEDLDALLAEFDAQPDASSTCKVCKVSVRHLMGMFTTCQYCKCTFCYTHLQAEVHGCGDAASKQTQAILRKRAADPKAYANVSKVVHEKAKSALSDKLKEAREERTGGDKDKKKKGKK